MEKIPSIGENCRLKLWDGKCRTAQHLRVGDTLFSPTNQVVRVARNIRLENPAIIIPMVQLTTQLVSYTEPVNYNGKWIRACELPRNKIRRKMKFICEAVHIIITEPPASLYIDDVECGTFGQECLRVDEKKIKLAKQADDFIHLLSVDNDDLR